MTPCTVSSWPRRPDVLDDRGLADVHRLLDHVELAESVEPLLLGQRFELDRVLLAHVHHVAEPVVDQAVAGSLERRLDAAAAVVAADDYVLHPQHVDCVLEHGEAVEVGVPDHVRDVAVDEDLARREADDLVRGNAAVRAADPEVLGRLPLGEAGEVVGIIGDLCGGPGPVPCEEIGEIAHGSEAIGAVQQRRQTSDEGGARRTHRTPQGRRRCGRQRPNPAAQQFRRRAR